MYLLEHAVIEKPLLDGVTTSKLKSRIIVTRERIYIIPSTVLKRLKFTLHALFYTY
jgi:hypothetical protein